MKHRVLTALTLCTMFIMASANSFAQSSENPTSVTITVGSGNGATPKADSWEDHPSSISLTVGAPSIYSLIASAPYATCHPGMNYFGSYALRYDYNVLRWLSVGARLSYDGWQFRGTHNSEDTYRMDQRASLLMQLRFTYINRPKVQLYSGVGVGMAYMFRTDNADRYSFLSVAGMVTPIGIHVGSPKVYGLAEINLGTEALMSMGIGFNF